MFAQRGEGDIANHHHLVVSGFEGNPEVLAGIGLDPLEQFDVHVGHPSRCLEEPLARRVFANGFEELTHEALHARVIDHD